MQHRGLIERGDNVGDCRRLLLEGVHDAHRMWDRRRRTAVKRGFDGLASRRIAEIIYDKLGLVWPEAKGELNLKDKPMRHAFLVGEKIYLRGLEREDISGNWYQWFNDEEVTRYMVRGAFPTSVESHTEFYEHIVHSSTDLVLAICDKNTGAHIGNVGLHRIDWINRSAEFGIVIGEKAFWGRGYGTEATKLIISHGFRRLNLRKIFLGVCAEHVAAIKAYERSGFRQEAVLKSELYRDGRYLDKVLMSIFATDFYGEGQG